MKPKKRKDDTGLYMRQWNMELRETISRNMIAYEQKVRECKELRKINKDLKMLCSKLEKEHETVYQEWKAVIEEDNDNATWWRNRYNAVERENRELKNNRDKAIEYIENDMPYLEEPDDDYENNHKMNEYDTSVLLNILKGDSDYE